MGLKSVFIMTPGFKGFVVLLVVLMVATLVFALLDYVFERTMDRYPGLEKWLWDILGL